MTDALRDTILAALRRRDSEAVLVCAPQPGSETSERCAARVRGVWVEATRSSRAEALADVAVVCGLRPDGSDPAAELERLRCVTRTRLTPPQGA